MMNRSLVYVVGLGPGGAQYLTAQAQTALQAADVLCGYTVYIDLVRPPVPGQRSVYATGMTQELDRCRWALETAQRAARRWRWSAPATPGSTAWPARCWSWRSTARSVESRDRARPDGRFERRPRCWVRRWHTIFA